MPLLIDANNVLHAVKPPLLAGLDEPQLCRTLARSTLGQDQPVTVVCDGAPGPLAAVESPVEGVELTYAGAHRTADDAIIERIERDTAPRRLIVVSTDRQIRRAARRRRAQSWTSEEFLSRLAADLSSKPAPGAPDKPDPEHMDPEQVNDWMQWMGLDPDDEVL